MEKEKQSVEEEKIENFIIVVKKWLVALSKFKKIYLPVLIVVIIIVLFGWNWFLNLKTTLQIDVVKAIGSFSFAFVGFIIAGISLYYLIARTKEFQEQGKIANKQAETARQQAEIAANKRLDDRFKDAVILLGNPHPSVRIGGIYALNAIALSEFEKIKENKKAAEKKISYYYYFDKIPLILCGFVREQSKKDWNKYQKKDPQMLEFKISDDVQTALNVLTKPLVKKNNKEQREENIYKKVKLDFHGAKLRGAKLRGAFLIKAELVGADLRGAFLRGAFLIKAELAGADLSGAFLSGAFLIKANLSDANLSDADLSGANLRGVFSIKAELVGADLTGADLTSAMLIGIDLSGAILNNTDFAGVHLYATKFNNARLRDIDFSSIILSDLEGMHERQPTLGTTVIYNNETLFYNCTMPLGQKIERAMYGNLHVNGIMLTKKSTEQEKQECRRILKENGFVNSFVNSDELREKLEELLRSLKQNGFVNSDKPQEEELKRLFESLEPDSWQNKRGLDEKQQGLLMYLYENGFVNGVQEREEELIQLLNDLKQNGLLNSDEIPQSPNE